MFMGGIVVEDDVDRLAGRDVALDGVEILPNANPNATEPDVVLVGAGS
jgi:hypothetical protein